eukprot:TRINITY_DN3835_c0_g1_i2.p1 TRINITY_DN3835_c0_g1~~TRINITY_DN3835_c0_g1_i2.p1  ORF type:complete len:276 (+),score=89.88 TRINITY_DN3835_c0_g1_i2:75-902(+)
MPEEGEYEPQVDETPAPGEKSKKKRGGRKKKEEEPAPAAEPEGTTSKDDGDEAASQVQSHKSGHIDEEEDPEVRTGAVDHRSYNQGVPTFVPKKTHLIMLSFLATTWVCLLAIVPSRSLGVGKYTRVSCGAWSFCHTANDGAEDCQDLTNDFGERKASGVFGILCILLVTAMLVLEIVEFIKPGRFAWFVKAMCGMHHALWLFLLISWACWASFKHQWNDFLDDTNGGLDKSSITIKAHLYYAWGFIFLIFMWLIHMVLAAIWTLKVMGKSVLGL